MRNQPKGFSLLEVLVVLTIVMVLASMAIPNIQRSRTIANETATVASLTALNDGCSVYWTEHDSYPRQLDDLWPGAARSTDTDQAASVAMKAGYIVTYRAGPADPRGRILSYSVTAVPLSPGVSGRRSFFTDDLGPIRATETGEATTDSPSISLSR